MKSSRKLLALTTSFVVLGTAVISASGATETRCSKLPLPSGRPAVFFLGTASAEVLDAPVIGAMGLGADTARFSGSVPSQVFDVERIDGADRRLIPAGTERVVVVPWGYSADCRVQQWTGARWVDAGVSGLIYGLLRAPEHWVNRMPTLDVHEPYQLPYARATRNGMNAADAFTMLALLPSPDEVELFGITALAPLIAWTQQRPELMRYEPGTVIRSQLIQMTMREVQSLDPPMAGTYRFVLDVGDGRPRTFYARTESHPVTIRKSEAGTAWLDELRPPTAFSYELITAVATSAEALPSSRADARYGYVNAAIAHELLPDGTRVWPAGAELTLLRYAFPADVTVQRLVALEREALRTRVQARADDATFRMQPNGRVTFEQRYRVAEQMITLRGERISSQTIPTPRY